MFIASIAIFVWAERIINIFSSEADLVELASTFLRIATAGYLVMGITAVLQQSINGAGDTLVAMVVMLANIWLAQLPLAFLLPQLTNLGVFGVRWAIVIGTVTGAIAYTIYFRLGRWQRKKV
jgi:MATE family multidrug resistance protein